MVIEVAAKLVRGSVYFAGEKIQCTLRFQNVSDTDIPLRLVNLYNIKNKYRIFDTGLTEGHDLVWGCFILVP